MSKKTTSEEKERQLEAREKVGMGRDTGKSYREYLKEARGRDEDHIYKATLKQLNDK